MNKIDDLAHYLSNTVPDLVEDDIAAANTIVVTVPQESPAGAITREDETAKTLLDRVVRYNMNWVKPGHRSGDNYHNVSCTVSVKDNEWDEVEDFMWKNRANYAGMAILPFQGGEYKQAPFESCTKETYEKFMGLVKEIDLKQVIEMEDLTTRNQIIACAGGACSLE
jgi:ribonucleoside-diphosphate reductase alpha chain